MLLASSCTHTMQLPNKVPQSAELKVERYGGLAERELKVGGAVVTDIKRSWSRPTGRGVVNFDKAPDETTLDFTFKYQQTVLTGGCVEHLTQNMMGLKDPKVSLTCQCREGGSVRAELELEEHKGPADLPGLASYQVSALHKTTQGKYRRETLGYWFKGKTGEGAIELRDDGRAWLPPQVTPEERPVLLCLYAAMLLYRPGQAL